MGRLGMAAWDEREIVVTRAFSAGRTALFDALTTPAMISRWLLGPPGWTMPVCDVDLRVGGEYRYLWRSEQNGAEFGARGTYREILPGELLAHSERFDEPWYPGEALVTTVLTAENGGTVLRATVLYESRQARDGVMASPMEHGVAASYDRLEALLLAARSAVPLAAG